MTKEIRKKDPDNTLLIIKAVLFAILIAVFIYAAHSLFGEENSYFIKWWVAFGILGLTFFPLTSLIFSAFHDSGWMFSKAIGLAVSGWLTWYLSSIKLLKFTRTSCIAVVIICLAANILLYVLRKKKDKNAYNFNLKKLSSIISSEAIFFLAFLLWTYLKGFNPEAYGTTEKLMDFGFMKAMFNTDYYPVEDLWLSGNSLNYYYVGQFMATFLTKFSGITVEYGYNFMLTMLAALSFAMPYSIIANVARSFIRANDKKEGIAYDLLPRFCGALAGMAVSLAGNMQYVIYAVVIPHLRDFLGITKMAQDLDYTFKGYWFPNATRYIGYFPETKDKTIHEFPLYSFVLGDLHAHVINIMFVLTVIALLFAWLSGRKAAMDKARNSGIFVTEGKGKTLLGIPDFYSECFNPAIVLIGFFIGLFHTTNFWDYPIYFVVSGAVILFSNAVIYDFSKKTLILTAAHAAVVLVIAQLVCLPFTLSFKQISTSVNLCDNHTPLYQLLVLWGLPVFCVIYFLCRQIGELQKKKIFTDNAEASRVGRNNPLFRLIGNLEIPDLFIIVLGLCAIGLVLIPEVIYVKDIYSGDYKRANTMFKLTYQAYIMFGLSMGYIIPKFLFYGKEKGQRVFAVICGILLISTMGYFGNSTKAWFGDYKDRTRFKGLNAGEYLLKNNEEDYYATNWLMENVEGRPVVLEVNGPSYTDYNRVSARTGLPTLLGWKTHEWLWQSDGSGAVPEIVSTREADIETIYTTDNEAVCRQLVEQYDISYIYVGSLERTKYENKSVNHELLQSLGEVVYPAGFNADDSETLTYIIKVKK